jgi:hypothetical protein
MLYSFFFTHKFKQAAQSGFYIDFFLKNVAEIIIRNVLIYSGQFFCEKYLIEYFTKKLFNNFIYFFNQIFKNTNFNYISFFLQIITIILYVGAFFNFLILIF